MPSRKDIPTASFSVRPPGSKRKYTAAELSRMERESDEIARDVARIRRERDEKRDRENAERARERAKRAEVGRQVRERVAGNAKGGKVKKMAKGGKVNCRRGDGICRQGRTKGKMR